ncbi:polysaccharide deacetylase family sporulation protein PdaB [Aquibacillus rhizosphaerae]|uniref:Polysaccharide deacetylase family sporulation protein PdaB n=1 Tax=Aquibacillus rhizosphaerae TaxID=3051431 RepID=A0ABT7L6F2_9BACI|nr:polysaccharide deacetylase family sporulation protein PdaB [Aquibacillus sp. LR5S19]MDL4841425.1 polysaccharide deacetylase family sporulation protein PdaB [Aquibacillus sp. LR5S19]
MQHFYVLNVKKRSRLGLVLAAALFTAIFLWVETESSFSVFSTKDNPAALSKGSEDDPNISLTFNISWGNEMVEPILEQLKKHDVQATFFVSGEWAERHPALLKKIEEDEHEIGMMGYRYKSYLKQEQEQIKKDLLYAQEIFSKLGYEDTKLMRTPSGHFNKKILELIENQNYKVIQWNVNPEDWKNPGEQIIIDRVMEKTSNGDIILLHASDSVKQTPKALETILPGLKNKGFEFVSISELISRAESKSEEVE